MGEQDGMWRKGHKGFDVLLLASRCVESKKDINMRVCLPDTLEIGNTVRKACVRRSGA